MSGAGLPRATCSVDRSSPQNAEPGSAGVTMPVTSKLVTRNGTADWAARMAWTVAWSTMSAFAVPMAGNAPTEATIRAWIVTPLTDTGSSEPT